MSKRGLWPSWNPSQRELDELIRRKLDERDEQERRDSEHGIPRASQVPALKTTLPGQLSLRSAALIGALAGIPTWVRAVALLVVAAAIAIAAWRWGGSIK